MLLEIGLLKRKTTKTKTNKNKQNNNSNNNNNNNNVLLTVYPPSVSSLVKNYNIKKTVIYYKKNWIEIYNIKSKNIGL